MTGVSPKVNALNKSGGARSWQFLPGVRLTRRQLREPRLAHQVVSLSTEFSRDDVGPAGEQIQRQAGGHGRYLPRGPAAAGWDFEFAGGHAEQSRKAFLPSRRGIGAAQADPWPGGVLRPLAVQLGCGDQAVAGASSRRWPGSARFSPRARCCCSICSSS